jgi:hypothetical protein
MEVANENKRHRTTKQEETSLRYLLGVAGVALLAGIVAVGVPASAPGEVSVAEQPAVLAP